MEHDDIAAHARDIISANSYLTLGTTIPAPIRGMPLHGLSKDHRTRVPAS